MVNFFPSDKKLFAMNLIQSVTGSNGKAVKVMASFARAVLKELRSSAYSTKDPSLWCECLVAFSGLAVD